MIENLKLHVTGMTCGGCENAIRLTLRQLQGVSAIAASHKDERVEVSFDGEKVTRDRITRAIEDLGYQVSA
jgi:copper ion binding protein